MTDEGTGAYVGTYTLTSAGPYKLTLSLHSSAVTFSGVCEPGVTHTPSCRVRCDPPTHVVRVGEQTRLTVERYDAHGNALASSAAKTKLRVKVSGPGPASSKILEQLNGTYIHLAILTITVPRRVGPFEGRLREAVMVQGWNHTGRFRCQDAV